MSGISKGMFARGLRFGVVGVLTAVLHYGVLLTGVALLGIGSTLASSIGFVVAVCFNYAMHYHWTFSAPEGQQAAPHGRALRRFLVMVACGCLINAGIMYCGVHQLHWNYLLAQGVALLVVVSWNFTLANSWVFRV
ncbi:GtrA family protein [Haliea sp. E17]|uniref:GtrA family protein n=1 Tax=Haliea sp. E17 TaxID=3401576 RepID=UPI003AAD3711